MADPITISCPGTCTVTVQLEPAPITSEKIADMSLVWSGFLLAAIVVMGLRKLLNVFDSSPHVQE
jgi:hypothetical protein